MRVRIFRSSTAIILLLGTAAPASSTSWSGFPLSATVEVWCAPSKPPAAPTYSSSVPGFPTTIARLGPSLPGCSPLTQGEVIVDGRLLIGYSAEATWMARGGDIVDSPVLLPLVTASSSAATGSATVSGTATGPNAASYTVTWSGSDAGVAARIEWFEAGVLINSVTRTGPWSETTTMNITSTGPIEDVDVIGHMVAVSLPAAVPAVRLPGVLALGVMLGATGLAMRARRDARIA